MKRTKIAIIFGGNSTEYDVSLQSAASVCKHLNADRYEFALIGITWQGDWYHYVGEHENILDNTWYKEGEKLTPVVVSLNFNEKGFLQLSDCSYRLISVDLVFPYYTGKMVRTARCMAGIDVPKSVTFSRAEREDAFTGRF